MPTVTLFTSLPTYQVRGAKEFPFSSNIQGDSDASQSAVLSLGRVNYSADLPDTSSCNPHHFSPKNAHADFGRTLCIWKTEGQVVS